MKQKHHIAGTEYDLRRKLTPGQREEIRQIREAEKISYAKIAARYGVTRAMIFLICNPSAMEAVAQRSKERSKERKGKAGKERCAEIMRNYRRRRQQLIAEKKI